MPRAMALDYGEVRIGVAVEDELGMLAHPRKALAASDRERVWSELRALAKDENISQIVVGLPLDLRGREGIPARKARAFAQQVADVTGLEVELWDERLSTVEATRRLRESEVSSRDLRAHVDSSSAAILLQSWLRARVQAKR